MSSINGVKLRTNMVASSQYSLKSPYSMKAEYITIHNTANDASAWNEISYMKTRPEAVSFHLAVDDKEVVQGLPYSRNGWHAGDGDLVLEIENLWGLKFVIVNLVGSGIKMLREMQLK